MGSSLRRGALLACAALLLLSTITPARAAAVDSGGAWLRPVDGALVRPFQEPTSVYGAGHRGADLTALPGTPVRAANDGEVTFAGSVAGTLHVTITHAGGLRTSYSFLQSVEVRAGAHVTRGDVLGTTGGVSDDHDGNVLHLGLRLGDRYLDPMLLFHPVDLARAVRLAPVDPPDEQPWTEADERRELSMSLRLPPPGRGATVAADTKTDDHGCGDSIPLVGDVVSSACDVGEWVGDRSGEALDVGLSTLHAFTGLASSTLDALRAPLAATLDALRALPDAIARGIASTPIGTMALDLVAMGRRFVDTITAECSTDAPDADGTGGSMHRAMVVAGITSSGPAGADGPTVDLDVTKLGYHAADGEVRWFSYAADGGAYEADDTFGPLVDAAQRLRDQLRVMQREQPGREVDLIAHSQGGVVVDAFLALFYEASDPTLPPLGTVVTVSSPHQGAPLATAGDSIRSSRLGESALDAVGDHVPSAPAPNSAAVKDLSERSKLIAELRRRGLPDHFDVTSIGATEDVIVPADHIALSGRAKRWSRSTS